MHSQYLADLSPQEREAFIQKLFESQRGVCFVCEEQIDLQLHKDALDIDHIIPLTFQGRDDPSNFALTHSSCNRTKQAANLEIARLLFRFNKIKDNVAVENRGPNLEDILDQYNGAKYDIPFVRDDGVIRYSLPDIDKNQIIEAPIYVDALNGFEYFFAKLPIEYLHHDDKINPRSIGQNVSKLIEEFYKKRPQLHISLAWISLENAQRSAVKVFDGQHKAAAQVLLGTRELPVRVFINPDKDTLLTANTNAGTTLRQVAFDKSVQRHLGSALYFDRIERFKAERGLTEDDWNFSESDLVKHFQGESVEIKRYILDAVRDSITHSSENKLKDYIDFGGRAREKPLSYSTVEKTFYSFFIYQKALETPLQQKWETGENPRQLEVQQILELMNIIAEELFVGKFDTDIGTYNIEKGIRLGKEIPLDHLRAYRLSKEEIIYNWLKIIEQIIKLSLIMRGGAFNEAKLFQYRFPTPLWDQIRCFIKNFANLPVWINKELAATVFGGKQNNNYWQIIFETGKSAQGMQVLAEPINWKELIKC